MSWRDRECPTDSRDAYYEGRRSSEYERNPYEHGRDSFADRDCREAHDEWSRGQRYAQYDREERQREAEEQHRAQQARYQREQECATEEAYYAEQQYPEPEYPPEPEPPASAQGEPRE
jgi:hypothetical protein